MSDLRTRCLRRAGMENDDSVSSAEVNALISEMYGELYEEVADSGYRYFESSTTFTTSGLAYIDEPTDHLSMVDNIELVLDANSGRCRRLFPLQPQERAAMSGMTGDPWRFEMVDDRFYLYPTPASGKTLTLRYIPQSPDLSTFGDSDVVDVVTNGGETFLVWGTVVKLKSKDERDVTLAIAEREKARERLQQWAMQRARDAAPRRIVEDDFAEVIGDWRDNYV